MCKKIIRVFDEFMLLKRHILGILKRLFLFKTMRFGSCLYFHHQVYERINPTHIVVFVRRS
jgi:hypothetical protein